MKGPSKLLDMLVDYAAAHQHPVNVAVHLIGIPAIMVGTLVPLTWASLSLGPVDVSLAHLTMLAFVASYWTLDRTFALVFLLAASLAIVLAEWIGQLPLATALSIAGVLFFGGYAAQFIGHAIEKSMPVLVRHPVQAQLAAPFFTIVELFKIFGLRRELFDEVQRRLPT